jgi:4-hydroxybenzoyl-CoA thioesterase
MSTAPLHSREIFVGFGDCDPAGIVYYPNFLRWVDATFLDYLRVTVGGHARLCRKLDILGLGLMATSVNFRSPVAQDDCLTIRLEAIEWGGRSFTIRSSGYVGDWLAFQAEEKRGLFARREGAVQTLETTLLKEHLTKEE